MKRNHKKDSSKKKVEKQKSDNKQKPKQKATTRSLKSNIFLLAIILALVGILTYTLSLTVFSKSENYAQYIKPVVNDISIIFMTVALGSCLLEWFGFVDYMKIKMAEVVTTNKFLKTLSNERKIEIKEEIEREIYSNDNKLGTEGLLSVVQNEIYPLLKSYYFKEYVTSITLSYNEDIQRIVKNISKTIIICNNDSTEKDLILRDLFSPSFVADSEDEVKTMISLESIKCTVGDGKTKILTSSYKFEPEEVPANDGYNYEAFLVPRAKNKKSTIKLGTEEVKLEIEYTTMVDKEDITYIQRVPIPCKDFTIHYNYTNDFKIDGNGFSFLTRNHNSRILTRKEVSGYTIRFRCWMLPGDGVCFYNILK